MRVHAHKLGPSSKFDGISVIVETRYLRCVKTLSEFCFIVCLQLETPEVLKTVPWLADYKPPGIPDENTMTKKTPEEIEREIKLQGTIKNPLELNAKSRLNSNWAG